ncbi:MAG: hypothetical protein JXR70_18250 [Spirochaetales bacterium]|nr:hypothetical protein [Spirochaetales bacterium]
MKLSNLSVLIIGIAFFTITACPISINSEMILNIHDNVPPVIEIFSPSENFPCANIVEIKGRVRDSGSNSQAGKVIKIGYEVPGFNIQGETVPERDGSFLFLFETITLGPRFTIKIWAYDWNNNRKENTISLYKIEKNGIPSFAAKSGNQQITLSWEDLPGTETYTLYYTTNRSLPGELNGNVLHDITSPLTLNNLKNGYAYIFQLKTKPKNGFTESSSDYLKVIPLSPQNLTPHARGEYQQITIEWNAIAGTDEFEVWRAYNMEGPYINLSGPIKGTRFIETNVKNNQWYYYKIKPALEGCITSHATGTQASPFPAKAQFMAMLAFGDQVDNILQDIKHVGSYLYIADKNSQFYVVDISQIQSPRLIQTINMPSACFEIDISGSYAYVANYLGGLQIIDIHDPENAFIAASVPIETAYGVAVSDSYAYVADFCGKLQVIDISNPLDPSILKPIDLPGSPYKVAVSGSYAYVVSKRAGLLIMDIKNPDSPKIVNSIETSSDCYNIAIQGNYAYIADACSGVIIVDIQNPESANKISTIPVLDYAFDIVVKDNFAYVAENNRGFQIINISNPSSAVVVDSIETNGVAEGIAVSNTHVFIAGGRAGLQIFDVSKPYYPSIEQEFEIKGNALFTTIHNSRLYVSQDFTIMQIFDMDSTVKENTINSDILYSAHHIAFTGPLAYIANRFSQFRIVNMDLKESPKSIQLLDYHEIKNPTKTVISGSYAYLADADGGLKIIDINQPESAYILRSIKTPNSALSVALKDHYAYVADSFDGMIVIDISNPFSLCLGKTVESTIGIRDMVISGDYAYAINYYEGLQIISLRNPESPEVIDTLSFDDYANGIDVSGFYAYIASGKSGLKIIDISDPDSAKIISTVSEIGDISSVSVSGHYAFVTNNRNKLFVINLLEI